MNKYFKSLKETYEKACNYKIDKEIKEMSKEKLEHLVCSQTETSCQYQHIVESILYAIKNNITTLKEIKQYIEENDKYMIVYPRYEEF